MVKLSRKAEDALVDEALRARERAYAPYSRFLVGAALLCDDGDVVTGCNVENASYGLCICAERTAISAAVAGGKRAFTAIAISTASSPPSPPCGMCRQVLAEFASDLLIVLVNPEGERERTTLKRIFPGTFTSALLHAGQDSTAFSADSPKPATSRGNAQPKARAQAQAKARAKAQAKAGR